MTALHELFRVGGQSPWIDDLKRSYVTKDGLAELVEKGIRGVTSNPTIMAKSIEAGSDYDEQFAGLMASGMSIEDAYWELVLFDIRGALSILRPTFDDSRGDDGFVSVEVLPDLAHDTQGTIEAARELHQRVDEPNVFVKIPATKEGLPAIEEMIAEGRSTNVTLIFSLERYAGVIESYLRGLERLCDAGGDPSSVASVASFFVSRVDTEVDRRLEEIMSGDPLSDRAKSAASLRGTAAICQARLAYKLFLERFSDARFAVLKEKGARMQRPLWASTSTKNPSYPDLFYVEGLIVPNTVDTMPGATIDALVDHGKVTGVAVDFDESERTFSELSDVGIDMDDVAERLEREGVASFSASFDELMDKLREKSAALKTRS